jgi:hypothetical protein
MSGSAPTGITHRSNTTPHGHVTVSRSPFQAGSVASAVRAPWGRWSAMKSARSVSVGRAEGSHASSTRANLPGLPPRRAISQSAPPVDAGVDRGDYDLSHKRNAWAF